MTPQSDDRITPKPGARIVALRQQIWPGPGIEAVLSAHIERQYGGTILTIERMDAGGVYGIEWTGGARWVARLFPALRPMTAVEGDAEVLRFLAAHEFPAERCAHAMPVSSLEGRGVLVTERVEGSNGREVRGVRYS